MPSAQLSHVPDNTALASALARHVEVLAGSIGERNVFRAEALHAAAAYITRYWESLGLAIRRQGYEANGVPCANLEIEASGGARARDTLVLGAHYDTVRGSPGADDNASGIAALLEIAAMLQTMPHACTVRCVAFVNEEAPFFFGANMGSVRYAKAARARGDRIRLMVSLDMLGYYRSEPGSQTYPPWLRYFYPDRGDFLGFVSNLRCRAQLRWLTRAYQAATDFPMASAALPWWVPGVAWSDHSSFWRQGYPAVMITDTAYLRNPNYHTARDLPQTLNYGRMAQAVHGIAVAVASLG